MLSAWYLLAGAADCEDNCGLALWCQLETIKEAGVEFCDIFSDSLVWKVDLRSPVTNNTEFHDEPDLSELKQTAYV